MDNLPICIIEPRRPINSDVLSEIWEKSVRATHHFLSDSDIIRLHPLVKEGLEQIATLVVAYCNATPIGFMGIEGAKIEMLFISPDWTGKGIGRKMIAYAVDKFSVKFVDVNEQNPKALGFYETLGFSVYDKSAHDSSGNPFPILHLKLPHDPL